MRWVSILVASICCGLTSCSGAQCKPGTYDGPWEAVGIAPPSVSQIVSELSGRTLFSANEFLRSPASTKGSQSGGLQLASWTFERRKKLARVNCSGPDQVTYRQDLMIVEATLRDGVVESCSVRIKGAIGERLRSPSEIAKSGAGPLDVPPQYCVKLGPGRDKGG